MKSAINVLTLCSLVACGGGGLPENNGHPSGIDNLNKKLVSQESVSFQNKNTQPSQGLKGERNHQLMQNQMILSGAVTGVGNAVIGLKVGDQEEIQSASERFEFVVTKGEPVEIQLSQLPEGKYCVTDKVSYRVMSPATATFGVFCQDTITLAYFHKIYGSPLSECLLEYIEPSTLTVDIKAIHCHNNKGFTQVLGLHYFPNLKKIEMIGNAIQSIDLTNNYFLERIELQGNQLTAINLSQNPALKHLDLRNNPMLEGVNLDHHKNLSYVDLPSHLSSPRDTIFRLTGLLEESMLVDSLTVNFAGDQWHLSPGGQFDVSLNQSDIGKIEFIPARSDIHCGFTETFPRDMPNELTNNIVCQSL
ncbi:MAG: hypothetical protein OXE99_01310 [Cellvibrionales bacterium]|nr:hypothetical protein [Cellvibrionales bacterium]